MFLFLIPFTIRQQCLIYPQKFSTDPKNKKRLLIVGVVWGIKRKTASGGACGLGGDPRGVRTHDPILKRDVLYQLS